MAAFASLARYRQVSVFSALGRATTTIAAARRGQPLSTAAALLRGRDGGAAPAQRTDLHSEAPSVEEQALAPSVFEATAARGFLPQRDPITKLPDMYAAAEHLLKEMPVIKKDGSAGLLASGDFGATLDRELPQLSTDHLTRETDPQLLTALFRDYTFLASAYLLEPCDLQWRRDGTYGLGRDTLPASVAQTLWHVSRLMANRPFMEYAQSYALYNWTRIDPAGPITVPNLELIRTLQGGPSEKGFILVHVAMVAHSNKLVEHVQGALSSVKAGDRASVNSHLAGITATMKTIHAIFTSMWGESKPQEYQDFRTFIFGIKGQPMFPNGVRYLGIGDDERRHAYRGESGANDSIIPTLDNLLQLKFPDNELTDALRDFRSYRPYAHNKWLSYVLETSSSTKFRDFCFEDATSLLRYLEIADQIREFRQLHWNLTKQYIIKYSTHPVATGGTPIVYWLPNQLGGVISVMKSMIEQVGVNADTLSEQDQTSFFAIRAKHERQLETLKEEVAQYEERMGTHAPSSSSRSTM